MKGKDRRALKKEAHGIEPKLLIGKAGVSDNTIMQIEQVLEKDELMKIRVQKNNEEDRHEMIDKILERTGAEFIQSIGNVIVIYKEKED